MTFPDVRSWIRPASPVFRMVVACVAFLLLSMTLPQQARAQARDADILIDLDQFGFDRTFRPGEIVPMRLRITNNPAGRLDQAVEVWVQWEIPNADGDVGSYGRAITLTRGLPMPVWLYAPVAPDARDNDVWAVRVFEMRDGQRRAEIGGRRVRPADFASQPVPLSTTLLGVIGPRRMGLGAYASANPPERLPSAYEDTRIISGIRPEQLPDRWHPLSAFEAIVWSSGSPADLTSDTARALLDYVRWGGHLVIVMPETGNPWQFGVRGRTALDEVLPSRDPRVDEGIQVAELVPVLSKAQGLHPELDASWIPAPLNVRVFKDFRGDFNAIDPPYEPLMALPDGRIFAIQRTLGFGRITIVGLDVAQQRLHVVPLSSGTTGMPEADVFWNRILGRRIDTPAPGAITLLEENDLIARHRGHTLTLVGSGAIVLRNVSIDMQAGLGLLLALLLFAAYWVLAGPGGFALLRMYKKSHHAWMAFAVAAGVFTAVAWGTVGMVRTGVRMNEPQIRHLSFLDHVASPDGVIRPEDPQQQRAISWFSLYTPGYARTQVSIDGGSEEQNLLYPWTPDEGLQRFPNADRFVVDMAHSPGSLDLPSRSTATLLAARWMGGLDPDWGGMIRADVTHPVRVLRDPGGGEQGLSGLLTHDFAGPLTNVSVIWVRNLRFPQRRYWKTDDEEFPWTPPLMSGQMLNSGYMWRLGGAWRPGEMLDLSRQEFAPLGGAILNTSMRQRYVDEYRTSLVGAPQRMSAQDIRNYLEMLSFFNQLPPPTYIKTNPREREPENAQFRRRLGRELDLSPWFTRPCLIVIGFLENSEIPVPVQLGGDDGRKPRSEGTTVVRWIYPLPLIEEVAFRQPDPEDTIHEGTDE